MSGVCEHCEASDWRSLFVSAEVWINQNLSTKCEMVPSEKQLAMIEFSMKHCAAEGVGGEWVG